MKKITNQTLLVLSILLTCTVKSFSQENTCTQTLRLAQSVYEQGRLQEIQAILQKCIDGTGMSIEERVNAYKLLCLTKIYLEEPEEADAYMLKILQTNNEFKANELADPAEFVALFKTFRSEPIYRLGGKVSGTATQPKVVSADQVNDGTSEYGFKLGFSVNFVAEIPLSGIFKNVTLNPELGLQNRSFSNINTLQDFETEGLEKQNWITLPLSAQYKVATVKGLQLYGSVGIAFDYLLSAKITATKLRGQNAASLPEKTIDIKEDRKALNTGLLLAIGGKKKVGKGYLIGEIRFQYGLSKNTETAGTFSNPTLTFDYGLVDSIMKLNTLNISVGYLINIYNPKKLTK